MSSTTGQIRSGTHSFDQTIANLKQGVDSAKTMQAEVSSQIARTAKSFAAYNQASEAENLSSERRQRGVGRCIGG